MNDARDAAIRTAAFRWLQEQTDLHGEVLNYGILRRGFAFEGKRIPLQTQRGIHKPAAMSVAPLTLTSTASGPYADAFGDDGLLRYAYCNGGPEHPDNRGLRRAMTDRLPLIYFHAVMKGEYLAAWPVFIVGDDPQRERVRVALDDARMAAGFGVSDAQVAEDETAARRRYITATFRHRLHQSGFRERVLRAYRSACAMCHFRHRELLEEIDGPMLRHGLQELHGTRIQVPAARKAKPDRDRLNERYQIFMNA